MDTNSALVLATVALVLVTGVMAWASWRYADLTRRQLAQSNEQESARALAALLADYGSPAMMLAVSNLWGLYQDCNGDPALLRGRFAAGWQCQRQLVAGATRKATPLELTNQANRAHLLPEFGPDPQRRLVSAFYRRLDMLVEKNVLSQEDADRYWTTSDRSIMSKIIEPIEAELRKLNWES